jgi:hypothetical protein
MKRKKTVRFVPHPETVRKYKILLMLFFLTIAALPILFVIYVSITEGVLVISFVKLLYMAIGYLLYAVGCFKAIDYLIKGYKIVYFNPKILTMNLIFELVLVAPIFIIFFGFWGWSLLIPGDMAMVFFSIPFILVLVYVVLMGFLINVFNFLSVYANMMYLDDIFEGNERSSWQYIMSSMSKLGTSIRYALTKEVIFLPAALLGRVSRTAGAAASQTLEIATAFTVPMIVLEKMGVKQAFEASSKMIKRNISKVPDVLFLLNAPELWGIFLALVMFFANMFIGFALFEQPINDLIAAGKFGMGPFILISQMFLLIMVPSVLFVLYYATVGSSSKVMGMMLFYFKLKGYPVDLETIKKYDVE